MPIDSTQVGLLDERSTGAMTATGPGDEAGQQEDVHLRTQMTEYAIEVGLEGRARVVNGGANGAICLASINVTHLENNARFVMSRQEDIVAIQEHKLSATGIREMVETFKKSGWSLMCGPAEYASKRINAGVGIISHSSSIIKGDRKTEEFEKAYALGRADKYIIDNGGYKDNITVFV